MSQLSQMHPPVFTLSRQTCDEFLPTPRYASAVRAVIVGLSVRPSVCPSQVGVPLRTAKPRITQTMP